MHTKIGGGTHEKKFSIIINDICNHASRTDGSRKR